MSDAAAIPATRPPAGLWLRLRQGSALPVLAVLLFILVVWYLGAVKLNAPQVRDAYERAGRAEWTTPELVADTLSMERPVLPAPHQVLDGLNKMVLQVNVSSRRSLVYHAWVTLESALVGFLFGTLLGIGLAVAIIHVASLERALMPWIIASQTIPILAIAPMIVVVLGSLGLVGLLPKAVISAYLCFFPVTIGMVKGLTSPETIQLDLMRTYSASTAQTLRLLRLPASLPFLFASLKVAISLAVVGAIVGELPTGAQAGLGARLLAGSYYGQTVQIWSALIVAAVLAGSCVGLVGLVQRGLNRRLGGAA
ncbi:ABC transporter permease [Ferrovibrio sp.]|uniref:ABC transporter permease n=1 Tax=Ferrovibrio sp. TaxID=1917215 RepID=UPI003512A243